MDDRPADRDLLLAKLVGYLSALGVLVMWTLMLIGAATLLGLALGVIGFK